MLFDSISRLRKTSQHCSSSVRRCAGITRGLAVLTISVCATQSVGCARRAYTDVYVESMASEIRDLEDQLYEFDSEYRVLEQELELLHAENARLRGVLPKSGVPGQVAPSQRMPGQSQLGAPSNAASGSPRLLPVPGSGAGSPAGNPNRPPATGGAAPSVEVNPPGASSPAPQASPVNPLSPSDLPQPQSVPGADSDDPYDLKNLSPPTIEPGESMPPILPAPKINPAGPMTLNGSHDLEIELGQIKVPAQLASGSGSLDLAQAGAPARLQPAVEMPQDTRIVEIKFHPSLCRAVNLDGEGDDDGLALVLQPLNSAGQFVPSSAELIIVAVDPSRDDAQRPAGRWAYKSDDVNAMLQPIGSSQGIHLSLPWTGAKPQADRVVVFAYYTLPEGRRIVAEQEIFLNNAHRQHTVWVPRATGTTSSQAVQTASGERPVVR